MGKIDLDTVADFRRLVRGHLADRAALKQSPETIWRALEREHGCELDDVTRACVALTAMGMLNESKDPMGGRVRYYQIAAAGILAHEAGE